MHWSCEALAGGRSAVPSCYLDPNTRVCLASNLISVSPVSRSLFYGLESEILTYKQIFIHHDLEESNWLQSIYIL